MQGIGLNGDVLSTGELSITVAPTLSIRTLPLTVRRGEVIGLIGANGGGKTTLLRALAGELMLSVGCIQLAGQDITKCDAASRARAGLRLLPQTGHVFLGLTVAENIDVALKSSAARRVGRAWFKSLSPSIDLVTPAALLSGGERQLLALCSLLSSPAQVYMLDEPYVGLDAVRTEAVRMEIRKRLMDQAAAALIVDHDTVRLGADCDRIINISELIIRDS